MKTIAIYAAILAVALAAPQQYQQQQYQQQYQQQVQQVQQYQQQPQQSFQPQQSAQKQEVVVVKETPSNNIGLDGYQYGYELSDGQKREESAQAFQYRAADNTEGTAFRITGSYSYVGPDGITYTVRYTADENGFHPEGAHLPVAPAA